MWPDLKKSPLWLNFTTLWEILMASLEFGKMFNLFWPKLILFDKGSCCNWPKWKPNQDIWPHWLFLILCCSVTKILPKYSSFNLEHFCYFCCINGTGRTKRHHWHHRNAKLTFPINLFGQSFTQGHSKEMAATPTYLYFFAKYMTFQVLKPKTIDKH